MFLFHHYFFLNEITSLIALGSTSSNDTTNGSPSSVSSGNSSRSSPCAPTRSSRRRRTEHRTIHLESRPRSRASLRPPPRLFQPYRTSKVGRSSSNERSLFLLCIIQAIIYGSGITLKKYIFSMLELYVWLFYCVFCYSCGYYKGSSQFELILQMLLYK